MPKQWQGTMFQQEPQDPKPRSHQWSAAHKETRERRSFKHNSLAQLLDQSSFWDMQLTHCASLQLTTNNFKLPTEMNSSVGSMSSLQESHLKQAGSCSEPVKISRKPSGTTQNGACYSHPIGADETTDNFREINIFQEEVTVILPGTAGKFSQLLLLVSQDISYRPEQWKCRGGQWGKRLLKLNECTFHHPSYTFSM